ncbi:MAG: HNH endonuclease, partial [Eubacterium sp.]|nr:HNH endonuclease [Eubacterium sp.]
MTAYIQKINELVTPLPYVLGESSKLKKEVH